MGVDWKPGCPEWVAENGSPLAEEKRRRVYEQLVLNDHSQPPTVELVKAWHRGMFEGIAPHPDYVGQFRDQEKTSRCLQDYEVVVGDIPGADSHTVIAEVDAFFRSFRKRLADLEKRFPESGGDSPSLEEISMVVALAAWAHGEWIRIHPFANGNGRTARLLANYVLVRFRFGPALSIRPRPEQPYGIAARASMEKGDHTLMETVIWESLARSYKLAK